MRQFRRETRYILIFFIALTMITIFSILDTDTEQKFAVKSLQSITSESITGEVVTSEIVKVEPGLLRAPASVNAADSPSLDSPSLDSPSLDSLALNKDFFCKSLENVNQHKMAKNMVMINFRLCHEVKLINTIALENLSNGFNAQIFKIEDNKFKTDYIQLNNGLNRLRLEIILKDGQKLSESLEILSGS